MSTALVLGGRVASTASNPPLISGFRGREYGGVESREDCESLPSNLQGGCYWRFNWARGDVNNWPIRYQQVQCPDHLTTLSGCSSS